MERAHEGLYDALDDEYYNCKNNVTGLLERALSEYEDEPPSTDDLVTQYKDLAKISHLSRDDYSDPLKVLRNNNALGKMGAIEVDIEKNHPEMKSDFISLLSDADSQISVAYFVLGSTEYDNDTQKQALDVIEKAASGDGISAVGHKFWLKDWYSKNSHTKNND